MRELAVFNFNSNNIRFEIRHGRTWVSLTDMAKASGKKVNDWNRLNSTTEFLTAFESVTGIPATETLQGGQPELQGTWAIEEVAIEFAGWCSVQFKIWMLQQIKTLMNQGYVALPQAAPQPKLPSHVQAVEVSDAVVHIQNNLSDTNPRLAQFLIDHAISDIMSFQSTLVAGSRLRGVVEIAIELGYNVNDKNRSLLGKAVKKVCKEFVQEEKRLVNGTMQDVCCYPDNQPEVIKAIHQFFSRPNL